jgi:hypothetical protein
VDKQDIRDIILETVAVSLEAQLRAVKRLRGPGEPEEPKVKGKSHIDMTYDILKRAKQPLHVSEIITDIERIHGVKVDRESLVSALTKKVVRKDRFVRTGKNTFALQEEGE